MLKRLPFLCAALLALAACSHDSDTSGTAQQAAPAVTSSAEAAPASTAPAAAGSAAPAAADTITAAPTATTPGEPAPAVAAAPFVDNGKWVEGKNYFRIDPAQPTSHPGKIEVTEVFSYGCPACNQFHPIVEQLAKSLPANAVMVYLPVSFNSAENFPMLQRAYYTAQALGVAGKAHDAVFDAVWKSGELSALKAGGQGLKPASALPTIEDAAKVYARFGVDPKEFVAVAQSFTVNTQVKRADELVKAYGVESTPTMVINGKYRYTVNDAGGYSQTIELAQWLVAKETAGK